MEGREKGGRREGEEEGKGGKKEGKGRERGRRGSPTLTSTKVRVLLSKDGRI